MTAQRTPSDGRTVPARLLRGTSWLALQIPLQIVFSLWSLRLILGAIGPEGLGAYRFAFGFGVLQVVLEAGAASALHRQLSAARARGDRAAAVRAIVAGLVVAAATAGLQLVTVLVVAAWAVPHAGFAGGTARFVVHLLWLQGVAAPFLGIAMVGAGLLRASHRYVLVSGCELAITVLRFAVLALGVAIRVEFLWIVGAQTLVAVVLRLGPALRGMIRELGAAPRFGGLGRGDCWSLASFGVSAMLVQLSPLLVDRVDVAALGFFRATPGPEIALYDVVSKPFLLLRQSGALLASMVVPAVAGLVATGDRRGLDRLKYDGMRLHIGLLLPVGLLAGIEAGPFLSLWFGRGLGYDASAAAPLMRLLLVATLPTLLAIPVQAAIGHGKVRLLAAASLAGLAINLPLSCLLAAPLGVAGVIWVTVLTTLCTEFVVPLLYLDRVLGLDRRVLLSRALGAPCAGAGALLGGVWCALQVVPAPSPGSSAAEVMSGMALRVGAGAVAFLVGYALVPAGRGDLGPLVRRPGSGAPSRSDRPT